MGPGFAQRHAPPDVTQADAGATRLEVRPQKQVAGHRSRVPGSLINSWDQMPM